VAASGWGGAARWSFAAVWRRRGPAAGFPKGELRVRHNSALSSLGGSELPRASPWRRRAPQGAFFFFLLFVQKFFYKTPPPTFFRYLMEKFFVKLFHPNLFLVFNGKVFSSIFSRNFSHQNFFRLSNFYP